MVAVHNFLNEGAWAEILEWEKRFACGLYQGWQLCSRGEENASQETATTSTPEKSPFEDSTTTTTVDSQPRLIRFQGRPNDMTPKAAMIQFLGRVFPEKFRFVRI